MISFITLTEQIDDWPWWRLKASRSCYGPSFIVNVRILVLISLLHAR